jgi:hypothetical protein
MKENPKYNIFHMRADDDLAERIRVAIGDGSVSAYLEMAVEEKLQSDADAEFRAWVERGLGR